MAIWDDTQYLKFGEQRTRPARELLARVMLGSAERVVDLGCGPGNSTALLRGRFPEAHITGVDNSQVMLQRARRELPDIEWVEADLQTYRAPQPLDLLFANAVLQWLPDHLSLLPALLESVKPGGVLAVQMPHNFDEPSHRLMRELPGPWARRIEHLRDLANVREASFYYDVLGPCATSVDVWQTTYQHVMDDADAIVEWVRGTALRPYFDALTDAERKVYLADYARAIDMAYPARTSGKRLFAFPRLFMVAVR